ncbi:uncharacterized protein LOC123504000 [Portunus trituberculatus]|uniref:uncharacterized protein LOC123504000 n=1 Tax=Portunus trituberculatus TaxID=210409 RepID=UPI001E1CC06C|nr:uncharacterized protein LOC123504000 [Portunus trituberculatus]
MCEKHYRSVKTRQRPEISALRKDYLATGDGRPTTPIYIPVQDKLLDVIGNNNTTISGIDTVCDWEEHAVIIRVPVGEDNELLVGQTDPPTREHPLDQPSPTSSRSL